MLKCREVAELIASDEWTTSSLGRRLALATHLAMCRHCRAYNRSLRQIGAAARALYGSDEDADGSARLLDAVRRAAEAEAE